MSDRPPRLTSGGGPPLKSRRVSPRLALELLDGVEAGLREEREEALALAARDEPGPEPAR